MSERLLAAIRESTVEEKRAALAELSRDLFRAHTSGATQLDPAEYESVIALLPPPPPEIAAQIPTDDPAWVAEMQRRVSAKSRGLTPEQFVAELKRRVEAANAPK